MDHRKSNSKQVKSHGNTTMQHTENIKNSKFEKIPAPQFHGSTVYNSRDTEAISVSIDRWMDREDVVITCNDAMEYCSATKRDVICSNIDAPRESHTKSSQTEKDITWYHLCVQTKKLIQINSSEKQ